MSPALGGVLPALRALDAPRRVALALLVALGLASLGVAGWSLAHGGIGWDARFDTKASLYVRAVDPSWTLERAYESVPATSEFYGVLVQQLADLLHRLLGGSTEHLQPDDPATYAYQGAVNLALSVLAVTALAVAIGIAFRSALAAAFTWALTLATPLWLGLSHVDLKDVPVAAGLTLVTAGLVLCQALGGARTAMLVGASLAGAGGAVALSTRAGSLRLLLFLAGGTVAAAGVGALRARAKGRTSGVGVVPLLVTAGSTLLGGLAFTWATNPIARIDLWTWLDDAGDVALAFPWKGAIRTAGRDLQSTDLPWWYVPAWLTAQLPLLTLAAVLGGLALLVLSAARKGVTLGARPLTLVPILLQGIALPVVIVASGAVLYDGIRHLLFVVPALVALAAVALSILERRAGGGSPLAWALSLGAVAVVAVSLLGSARWAPYAYAFLNPVAGRDPDAHAWELDYWGVSGREGVRRLEQLGLASVRIEPTNEVGAPWGAGTSTPRPGERSGLYAFFRFGRLHTPTGPVSAYVRVSDFGCTVVFTIERGGHVLGEGGRCPAAPA